MTRTVVYPAPSHDPVITGPPGSQIVGGLVEAEANEELAPAGLAAGIGDAPQPEVTVAPNADGPTAAGSALQATVVTGVAAAAGNAAATGDAPQPEATVAPNASNASSTGDAPQPEATIGALAGSPTAAGSALQATVVTGTLAPAGSTTGTGEAPQPKASIGAKPQPAATIDGGDTSTPPTDIVDAGDGSFTDFVDPEAFCTAVGQAFQPTIVTVSAAPSRPVVVTTAVTQAIHRYRRQSFAAFVDLGAPVTVEDVSANAGLAAATGTAAQPEAEIGAKPNTPVAVGSSDGQTVETGAFANAPAGLASATGTANQASVTIRPNAGVGLAAGVAPQSEAEIGAKPGFGLGAGTAPQPTVTFGTLAQAGLASSSGTANQPEIDIKVLVGVAAAAGEAFSVFALVGNPLGDPQGIVAVDDDHSLIARDHPVGLIAVDDDHSLEA